MDNVFRAPSQDSPAQPIPVPEGDNKQTFTEHVEDLAPIELGDGKMYEVLSIDDTLPEDLKENVSEIENYIFDILKSKGVDPTLSAAKREIENLKFEFGLDEKASVEVMLDRMGGVIKAWKNLSFVKDPGEKKKLFFKLANAPTSKEMNRLVFQAMEDHSIWQ